MTRLDLDYFRRFDPVPRPAWTTMTLALGSAAMRFPKKVALELDGPPPDPASPVIFAMNHTHEFDFLPVRHFFHARGHAMVTWIKTRAFQDRAMRVYLERTGNVPLTSRGYLVSADYRAVFGRKPTEDEYRLLRRHVDEAHPLPDEPAPLWEALTRAPRMLLDTHFDPEKTSYRDATRNAYFDYMSATLACARRAMSAGQHMHIYPEGTYSSRLGPGRTGLVQAALALQLPIVLLGLSGMNRVFKRDLPLSRGGALGLRWSAPFRVDPELVPPDFRAFHPDDEETHKVALQAETDRIMDRLDALLDEDCRRHEGFAGDGKRGLARFI